MPELGVHNTHNTHKGDVRTTARRAFEDVPKKKRKVSRYQREFGRQMKKLKAAHPRTKVTQLMSRGHTNTRKALGMKRRSR